MTQQNKTPVRKTLCGGFALAIPFAAILVMIGINALNLSTAEYRIKIRGYDPRDILRGHYLIFQYDWPFEQGLEAASKQPKLGCVCLNGDPVSPSASISQCSDGDVKKSCDALVKVGRGGLQPSMELRRFYIPELEAKRIEKLLISGAKTFEVGIVPRGKGHAQLKELYIDGIPMHEYLRRYKEDIDDVQTAPIDENIQE
jgi:hypothetical protein